MKIESSNNIDLTSNVLQYLGYPSTTTPEQALLDTITQALAEVASLSSFRYIYAQFEEPLDFLKHPSYQSYLLGSNSYLLCATTLGIQIDKTLRRWQIKDMAYALIFDAAASAYLEHVANLYEQALPFQKLGFRFCPGYGSTSLQDNLQIAQQLNADQIGITFLSSGLMVPSKSMIGILRIGGQQPQSCHNCVAFTHCFYRAHHTTCWKKK